MEQAIRNLIAFDHSYIINYPTVMFSTGPMFLSAQYGIYTASHPFSPDNPGGDVRILPKSLYGKNVKVDEAPNAFVSHHHGSSWHSDDAAFILFLGHSGMRLVWAGFFVLAIGVLRLFLRANHRGHPRSLQKRLDLTRYGLLLPRSKYRRYHLDVLGGSSTPTSSASPLSSPTHTSPPSPTSSSWIPLIPLSIDMGPPSASTSVAGFSSLFKRAGAWARAHVPVDLSSSSAAGPPLSPSPSLTFSGRGSRARSAYSRLSDSGSGMMLVLPAIFATPRKSTNSYAKTAHGSGVRGKDGVPRLRIPTPGRRRADSKARFERELAMRDLEAGCISSTSQPPPYGHAGASRRQQPRANDTSTPWNADDDGWE
jgi:hypothetical protein